MVLGNLPFKFCFLDAVSLFIPNPDILIYRETTNFTGQAFRLLYSDLSNVLSIHYICLNPFSLPNNKKLQADLSKYIDSQTVNTVTTNLQFGHALQNNNVFLMRNLKKSREITESDFEIKNEIILKVRYIIYRLNFCFLGIKALTTNLQNSPRKLWCRRYYYQKEENQTFN